MTVRHDPAESRGQAGRARERPTTDAERPGQGSTDTEGLLGARTDREDQRLVKVDADDFYDPELMIETIYRG